MLSVEVRGHLGVHRFPLLDQFVYNCHDGINTLLASSGIHYRNQPVDLGVLRLLYLHHPLRASAFKWERCLGKTPGIETRRRGFSL
jgi:hypothetical protein